MAHPPGSDTLASPWRASSGAHLEAGAHFPNDIVGRKGGCDSGSLQPEGIAFTQRRSRFDRDGDAETLQQLSHGPHIGQPGHIPQHQWLGRQQRCGHQLQRRILRAADGYGARQARASTNANPVHDPSNRPERPESDACSVADALVTDGKQRRPLCSLGGMVAPSRHIFPNIFRVFGAVWGHFGGNQLLAPLQIGP